MIPITNQKFGNPILNPKTSDLQVEQPIIKPVVDQSLIAQPRIEQPIIEQQPIIEPPVIEEHGVSHMNQNQEYNHQQTNTPAENYISEENGSPIILDKKLETNLVKQLLTQTLDTALNPPPDPIRDAMTGYVNNMATQFASNMFNPAGNAPQQVTKKGIFVELMNTAFGHGLGENVGNQLPNIIQSLTGVIGKEKTKELVENFNSNNNNEVDLEKEKQKDNVLALNSENPEQVRQYAAAMGLSDTAAKSILITHQTDIKNERQGNSPNQNDVPNNEIAEAMTTLIDTVVKMQNTMTNMQKELNSVKETSPKVIKEEKSEIKWDEELDNTNQSNDNQNVTLFENPISVDVDDIQGNNDPFFDKSSVNSVNVQTQPIDNTPMVETSVVETPVVETPVVETPVVETSVVETPVVETPVVETITETEHKPTIKRIIKKNN